MMTPEERATKVYRQWMSRAGRTPRDLIEGMSEAIRAAVAEAEQRQAAAVAAEREACAVEADRAVAFLAGEGNKYQRMTAKGIAAAIRARGGGEGNSDNQ